MEKLKLSLLQKWDISDQYTFVHSTGILNDGRALIFTREAEASDKYCVIMFSSSEVKKIVACDCSDSGRNYPVFFMCGEGFGIIKGGKQIEYYRGDFSVPEIIPIKNGSLISGKLYRKKPSKDIFRLYQTALLFQFVLKIKFIMA